MEQQEKQMSNEESLRIIQNMITSVKKDFEDDSFYFLFWGWLVFVASLGNYILLYTSFKSPQLIWLLMPLGGIFTGIYGSRQKKERKVKTYVGEFMDYIVIAFGVSLLITLVFQMKLGTGTYPMVLMLYAILLFLSGGAIQFKPLIIGGIINWVLAVLSFFCTFEIQLLILAAAVLLGYIIPGYMLKNKYKNSQNKNQPVIS